MPGINTGKQLAPTKLYHALHSTSPLVCERRYMYPIAEKKKNKTILPFTNTKYTHAAYSCPLPINRIGGMDVT
jgi:hypothetical protein